MFQNEFSCTEYNESWQLIGAVTCNESRIELICLTFSTLQDLWIVQTSSLHILFFFCTFVAIHWRKKETILPREMERRILVIHSSPQMASLRKCQKFARLSRKESWGFIAKQTSKFWREEERRGENSSFFSLIAWEDTRVFSTFEVGRKLEPKFQSLDFQLRRKSCGWVNFELRFVLEFCKSQSKNTDTFTKEYHIS